MTACRTDGSGSRRLRSRFAQYETANTAPDRITGRRRPQAASAAPEVIGSVPSERVVVGGARFANTRIATPTINPPSTQRGETGPLERIDLHLALPVCERSRWRPRAYPS